MRVRVLLFAGLRDRAGEREVALELPREATIEDAWRALVSRFPRVAGVMAAAAVNRSYAERSARLREGDEVAFLPPVSGG